MILKNTLGLVIAPMVLVSCSQVPLEHREPYAVVEVNKPAKEVYESLTAYPYCSRFYTVRGDFDKFDHSFVVRYNTQSFQEHPADYVLGEPTAAGTKLTIRSVATVQTPISMEFLNRLQTGNCK